jgi:hypothetical protein
VEQFVKALDGVAIAGERITPDATAQRLECIVRQHKDALRHVMGCGDAMAESGRSLRLDVIRAGGRLVQRLRTSDHDGGPTDEHEILGAAIISLALAGTCEHSNGPVTDAALTHIVRDALAVITGGLATHDSN